MTKKREPTMPRLNLMALRKPCTQMWLTAAHAMRGKPSCHILSTSENFSGFQVEDTHNASYIYQNVAERS